MGALPDYAWCCYVTELVAQVRRHLAEIPDLVVEASHYRTPGSAPMDPTFGGKKGKGSAYRILIDPEIFDLLDDNDKALDDVMLNRYPADWIWEDGAGRKVVEPARQRRLGVLPTLGLWVSLAYAELEDLGRGPVGCCPARRHTISGETAWLAEYAPDIIELHGDFARDIELLWADLRRACRIRREYIPKCNKCGNRIEAVMDGDSPAWWRCTGCPQTWVHDAEVQRLALTRPPMTLIEMATFLGKSVRDLYRLRDDSRFVPVGRSKRGGALYEVEQVRRAVQSSEKSLRTA